MKRFTATEKWDRRWFRALTQSQKLLWLYLCDRCEADGVIDFDAADAAFRIGGEVSESDLNAMAKQIQRRADGKLWLKDFISFQYSRLSAHCMGHKPVFEAAEKHGIDLRPFVEGPMPVKKLTRPAVESGEGATPAVEPHEPTPQEIMAVESDFGRIYEIYPKKKRREEALRVFAMTGAKVHLAEILAALGWQKNQPDWTKDGGRYAPTLDTYLADQGWTQLRPRHNTVDKNERVEDIKVPVMRIAKDGKVTTTYE